MAHARWGIRIRQHSERRAFPKGTTLSLLADDPVVGQYRFSALTTDLNLSAEILWRIYRGRADCENPIKARKYDFAADSFTMKTFWATEATLNPVMPAFNLISLLQQVLLKTQIGRPASSEGQPPWKSLRYNLFAKAANIPTEPRKSILNLTRAMQHQACRQGLYDAANSFEWPANFSPIYSLNSD
jgi:hypothetical protein